MLNQLPVAKAPMILVVNASNIEIEGKVTETLSQFLKHYTVKSRNMTKDTLDLVIEIRTADGDKLIKQLMSIDGVTSASLLSHDGEVTF